MDKYAKCLQILYQIEIGEQNNGQWQWTVIGNEAHPEKTSLNVILNGEGRVFPLKPDCECLLGNSDEVNYKLSQDKGCFPKEKSML